MVNFAPKTFRSIRCCTALKRWRCRWVKLRTPTVYVSAGKTNLFNASNVFRMEPAREQNIDLCFAKAARPCCVNPTMHLHRQSALAPPADRCNEMLRVDFFNLLCSPHITWPCTRRWFLIACSARPCLKALFSCPPACVRHNIYIDSRTNTGDSAAEQAIGSRSQGKTFPEHCTKGSFSSLYIMCTMSDSRRSVHSAGPSLDLVVAGLLVSFPLSVIDFLINVLKDCWF